MMNPILWSDLFILGQASMAVAPPDDRSSVATSIVLLAAGGMAFVGAIVWLGLRHARQEREMEHTERMKALEMGVRLPKDTPWWSPAKLAASLGVVVPIVALVTAVSTSKTSNAEVAWIGAGAVGVASVICGTILALRSQELQRHPQAPAYYKPPVDPVEHELSI
jgi:hypothetical protein